jgi:hypothetical protein
MVEEVNSCMIYMMHCNNLCKCHNVPPPITTIMEKNSIREKERKGRGRIQSYRLSLSSRKKRKATRCVPCFSIFALRMELWISQD